MEHCHASFVGDDLSRWRRGGTRHVPGQVPGIEQSHRLKGSKVRMPPRAPTAVIQNRCGRVVWA